jgi:hypothetical protein
MSVDNNKNPCNRNEKDLLDFPRVILALLYNEHTKEESDSIARHLEDNAEYIFSKKNLFKHNHENYKLLAKVALLENILLKDHYTKKEVNLFLGRTNYPYLSLETLDLDNFFEQKEELYRNSGRKQNHNNSPMSVLLFSPEVLSYVYSSNMCSIINHEIINIDAAEPFELIWQKIKKMGCSHGGNRKEFFNKTIGQIYPEMPRDKQDFYRDFFKSNKIFPEEIDEN